MFGPVLGFAAREKAALVGCLFVFVPNTRVAVLGGISGELGGWMVGRSRGEKLPLRRQGRKEEHWTLLWCSSEPIEAGAVGWCAIGFRAKSPRYG